MFKRARSKCLVFFVDEAYLPGLKVLLFSMKKVNTLQGIPIVCYSDEESTLDHPFIRGIATERIFMSPGDIRPYEEILPEATATPKSYRTFLKLRLFQGFGYDSQLFLDTDLLCLSNADDLLKWDEKHDVVAVPVIPSTKLRENKNNLYPPGSALEFRKTHFDVKRKKIKGPINTGVMAMFNKAVTGEVFDDLMQLARKEPFRHDQDCFNHYVKTVGNVRLKRLPAWFNVTKPAYQVFGEEQFKRDRPQIRFHHYTFRKPWQAGWDTECTGREANSLYLNQVWQDHQTESIAWVKDIEASAK